MDKNQIDSILYSRVSNYTDDENKKGDSNYENHYLDQYRMYLHIYNSTNDRANKSNDFFLGLNTAIIGVLGYLETKDLADNTSLIFLFAPLVGIAICYCWYQIIISYKNLNRAKFKVLHSIEERLPLSLFKTEWELLGQGKNELIYRKLSTIEKRIPLIFIVLYAVILGISLPWDLFSFFFL